MLNNRSRFNSSIKACIEALPSTRTRRTTIATLERIQSPRNTALYIPSSEPSTSKNVSSGSHASQVGKQQRRGGQLAFEGSYIAEIGMLKSICNRARQETGPSKAIVPTTPDLGDDSQQTSGASLSLSQRATQGDSKHKLMENDRRHVIGEATPKHSHQSATTFSSHDVRNTRSRSTQLVSGLRIQQKSVRPPAMLSYKGFTHSDSGITLGQLRNRLSQTASTNHHTKVLGKNSVRDILEAVTGTSQASMLETIKLATPMACNYSLLALGSSGKYSDVRKLVDMLQRNSLANEHTYGAAVSALDQAGRFDMAIQYFEELYRKGIDVGPVCSSVLIKLCAQRRDLALAFDIFHRLSENSTLNRYTYNCLIHLCASMGRCEEAVSVLRMMYEDGGQDSLPDNYTFSALLRAVAKSKQYAMLPRLYRDIQRSRIVIDSEVWCMLITVAGKAMHPELAWQFYSDYKKGKNISKSNYVDNALLSALAHHAPMKEVLSTYRQMLNEGLEPDEYTFNALLTSMARVGASLYAVQDIVGEMNKWNVKINMYLGTSLIYAYRRSPEMLFDDARLTTLLIEKVHDILTQLAADRLANSQTYGAVAGMHAQLGDVAGMKRVLSRMEAAGVGMDGLTCISLAKSCEDGGLSQAASHFLDRAEGMGINLSEHVGDSADKPKKVVQWWKKNKRL